MGFRSIGVLGRGGMAEVSLALRDDARSGEQAVVVVKRLRSDLTQHVDLQDMFLEEARISASLEHPNVVRTYEAGRDASGAFVAMEYLPGQALSAMLARVGLAHVDYDFCLEVLLGTLEGLEYVHELRDRAGRAMGLVHRDISPPNVFVTYDGQIKVLDFGIAKALGSPIRTRTGVVKGKVAYMAPEQALGQPVDARADLYAVGVMLWEMTSQRRRWPLNKPEGVILHELCQPHEPESPAAEGRGLPALANDVCLRALAFDPAARYPSARAMLADVRELAQQLGRRRSAGEVGAYVARQFADERRRQARLIEDALAGHDNDPSEGRQFAGTRVVPREAPMAAVPQRPLDTLAVANTTPVSEAGAQGVTPSSYSEPAALSGQLHEGSVVGEYRIIKQLGRGTFGTVYHAQHTIIGKQVAIKLLNAPYSQDQQIVQRFVDEARAVNRIAHPNIVDIFGFGELSDGRKYCIMELLDGETLAAYAERHRPCPWADAVAVLAQVAAALDAAHDAGIVHRDLKPENIFISGSLAAPGLDGKIVKLLDFGIAKVADGDQRSTASGVVLGTPVYMSPEQCRGVRVDRRTDIYSLGVVAYELLTGVLPFVGENAMQLIAQHITATPQLPTKMSSSLPKAIDDALLGMLAKAPEARPARATEAVDALAAALGIHISFRQPPPVSPAAAGTKSARAQLLGVAVVLLIAGLAVGGLLSKRSRGAVTLAAESASLPASSPPAAPALSAPTAPAVQADPTVTLRVSGEPVGAKIVDGTRELGSLGEALQLERSQQELVLQVKAPGFLPQELRLVPSRDLELTVTLRPAPKAKTKQDDALLY